MSRARSVITAVVVEGRRQAEVARAYGVSPGWVSRLVARYREEGESAFEPRSRRPKSSPTAIGPEVVARIVGLRSELSTAGLDAGPDTIGWHLRHHHGIVVSSATISRYLTKAGLVLPQPEKRPRSSYVRFAADQPNECWQSDFTHYRLTAPDGSPGDDVEILTWLDDHSRLALSVTAHHRVSGQIVLSSFRQTVAHQGVPSSTLTDNGMVFTTRLAGGKGGRNGLESELHRLGVLQKNSRPNHPTTCGKVERFQQTMKKWLRAQPDQPSSLAELQALIDTFVEHYNHRRPHRSLPESSTPAVAYNARPKAQPGPIVPDPHDRVRRDIVDEAGTRHLACQRSAPPHRRRTNPRPNPRPPARPRPPRQGRPGRHRGAPAGPGDGHDSGLSAHRGSQGPDTAQGFVIREGSDVADVLARSQQSRRWESNPRPDDYKSSALPTAPHRPRPERVRNNGKPTGAWSAPRGPRAARAQCGGGYLLPNPLVGRLGSNEQLLRPGRSSARRTEGSGEPAPDRAGGAAPHPLHRGERRAGRAAASVDGVHLDGRLHRHHHGDHRPGLADDGRLRADDHQTEVLHLHRTDHAAGPRHRPGGQRLDGVRRGHQGHRRSCTPPGGTPCRRSTPPPT